MLRIVLPTAGLLLTMWALAHAKPLPNRGDDKDPFKKPIPLQEMEKRVWHLQFPAGKKAEIKVVSESETDVDLHVQEMDGTEVVEDIDPSKDCRVEFTPLKNKTFRVSIINLGAGNNHCTVTHNGKVEQPEFGKTVETKPFAIAPDVTKKFDVKLKAGQWSGIWVFADKAADVDVFVFSPNGVEVANDEHVSKDCFVSFLPKTTGAYSVEVRNLGPNPTTCVLKHTLASDEKAGAK